jgi:hypothetical protein
MANFCRYFSSPGEGPRINQLTAAVYSGFAPATDRLEYLPGRLLLGAAGTQHLGRAYPQKWGKGRLTTAPASRPARAWRECPKMRRRRKPWVMRFGRAGGSHHETQKLSELVRASPALILSPICRNRRSHPSARGPVSSSSRMKASASCTSSRLGVQSVTLDPVSPRWYSPIGVYHHAITLPIGDGLKCF